MKKKSHKKLIIVLVIIIALIVVGIFAGKKFLDNKLGGSGDYYEGSYEIQLERVSYQDLSDTISLNGTVSGESKTEYSSTAEARIKELNVKVGDEVKAGDIIATFESEDIQAQIDSINKSISNAAALQNYQHQQNQKDLQNAKNDQASSLASAQAAIDEANGRYNAIKGQLDAAPAANDAVNAQIAEKQAELDSLGPENDENKEKIGALKGEIASLQAQLIDIGELQAALNAATADVNAAKNEYNAIKSSTDQSISSAQSAIDMQKFETNDDTTTQQMLTSLKDQLEDCVIVATADGIVTSVTAQAGDMNTPKAPIVTVENNSKMIMTASVPESDILKLEEGMTAVITASALGDVEIGGTVTKVVRIMSSDPNSGSSGFSVQITLDDSELLSGMSAKAKVLVTNKSSVLCVPYDLVNYDEDGNTYVLCAEEIGEGKFKAVKKTVEVGEESNYYVEVLGGEVAEGDYVIMDWSIMEGDEFEATIWDDFSYDMETEEAIAE